MTILIEAAVESLAAALAAAEGGADRIELCADLGHGGTTPSERLVQDAVSHLKVPVFVLVRPRPGDFVYTDAEHRRMLEQIGRSRDAGAAGIVTGALTAQQDIDRHRTTELIDAVRPLPVTFHRAFDACRDLPTSLERLIQLGVDRLLTSGGAATAAEGEEQIRSLVAQARGRIAILPGSGITPENVARLIRKTGVREVHFSVRDAEKVRTVIQALSQCRLSDVHPLLTGELWPASAYRRDQLPERVLQFGSGMLLRALCVAAVDTANRAGARAGRIVVVQSTAEGAPRARAINSQDGLFTLVERGLSGGAPLERVGLIGAISRALTADGHWSAVRDVAARPDIRVIVSNVSEAGFRIDAPFPGRLTDVLHARFTRAPDAPPMFVIPTELVPDNGPRLAAMVDELAGRHDRPRDFRDWLKARVRFCSSLVDRIVTAPPADQYAGLEAQLGYRDALLTVTEPYALWAIEADPAELHAAFPVDGGTVVFARDIAFYRERKLRLLNAVHTATAPLALLAGVRTVREATEHPMLAAFLKQLYKEIIPATDLPAGEAHAFAQKVLDRFANPWLEHEWRVIATNQEEKFRIRVVPLITGRAQPDLALAAAAHLLFTRAPLEALGEAARIPEFVAATTRWIDVLKRDGVEAAVTHD